LTAETVVEIEDIDDYRRFEAAVIADYDARTAVERELVLRYSPLAVAGGKKVWDKSARLDVTSSCADVVFDHDRNIYICPAKRN
jgi:hypothetical protein